MKHEIDLFGTNPNYPLDHRWDLDRNAKLLNIVFHAGTFGNFLRYFLERFSTKTPDIAVDPFTDTGTSHVLKNKQFSGLIQRYHSSFINDNKGETNLPVCLIVPSTKKHYLYLKKAQWFRSDDVKISPDDLWNKAVGEMKELLFDQINSIRKLYNIKEDAHYSWIPKFIVRDWYKQEFLQDIEDTYNYQWFDAFKKHKFWEGQKMFQLDLETFFDWDIFLGNITELNDVFGLALDFDRQTEMKEIFNKGLSLDTIRQESNLTEDVLENNSDLDLNHLDVATEAFMYAEMEKAHDFVQMPLTNRFFRDTEEMRQFVEYYPNHYKAMNPNMPKFNGIPNPYYLDKNK
tara:strand:- start:4 stop:1038 length:1035 start_codon:yes stop_codon:yes gene_type:complete